MRPRGSDHRKLLFLFVWFFLCPFARANAAPGDSENDHPPRVGLSGGLGVSYMRAVDIVNRINGSITTSKASEFVAGAEFYGAVTVPVGKDWVGKVEYAYLIASYNVSTLFPSSEFSVAVHMPTLIIQYVFLDRGVYNIKGGVGLGYHFGSYVERYGTVDADYTGSGVGVKLELEANTAFGENFYANLGGDIRFDSVGTLTDDRVQNSGPGNALSLNFFSVGAKLGFMYYF